MSLLGTAQIGVVTGPTYVRDATARCARPVFMFMNRTGCSSGREQAVAADFAP